MDTEIKEKLVSLKDNKATLFGSSEKHKTDELSNKIQEVGDPQDVQDSDEQIKLTSLESIKAALKDLQPQAISSSSLDEAKKLLEHTFSIKKESTMPEDDLEDLFSEEASQQDEENNDQQLDGNIDLSAEEKGSKKRLNEEAQKTDDKKFDIDFGSTFGTKSKKLKSKKNKHRPVTVNPLSTDTTTIASQWGSQQPSQQKQFDNLDVNADDSVRILLGLFAQEQGILPVQQRLIQNRKTAIFYQTIHRELGQMLTAIYLNLIHREAGKASKIVTHAMDYISAGSGLIPVPFASGVVALFGQLVKDGIALFNRHKDKEMQQSLGQVNEQVWNPAYAQYVAETVARNLTEAYEHY